MSDYSPRLVISKGNGDNEWVFELTKTMPGEQYVIGRYIGKPDIPLGDGEDDELCISKIHCLLVKKRLGWHIKDCSVNGTYLVRNNGKTKLIPENDYFLLHNDEFLIQDYCLRFEDPAKTRPLLPPQPLKQCPWVFNVGEKTLYRVEAGKRTERHLPPQLTTILNYMAEKKLKYGKEAFCTHQQLMEVAGGVCSKDHLYNIVTKIRNILSEADENNKKDMQKWLKTKTSEGYILNIICEP
jgi:hypothetical protein